MPLLLRPDADRISTNKRKVGMMVLSETGRSLIARSTLTQAQN